MPTPSIEPETLYGTAGKVSDRIRHLALQHHLARKHRRQFHRRMRGGESDMMGEESAVSW